MDQLLTKARALYKEREKIAIAALLIVGTIAFYLFYSPGIVEIDPPPEFQSGWISGFNIVASYNTVGFFLALSMMAFAYSFWTWAFLPNPAAIYTKGVLRGILGPDVSIRQSIGKRFRIILEGGSHIDVKCRIKGPGGNWFHYRLISSRLQGDNLDLIALRHGMSVQDGCFTSQVSSEELHSRTLLLAKAIMLAGAS